MPRYFFNVHHERSNIDAEGEELPDKHAAWREATIVAGETIREMDGGLQPGREWRLEVTDEFANPLYIIHVSAEQPKIVLKEHQSRKESTITTRATSPAKRPKSSQKKKRKRTTKPEAVSVGGLFHSGFRNSFVAVIRLIIASASSWRVRLNVPQM
jgi:hypothetical protein